MTDTRQMENLAIGNSASQLVELGERLFHEERFDDALRIFSNMTDFAPHNHRNWYNLAVVLFRVGRAEEAIRSLEEAVSRGSSQAASELERILAIENRSGFPRPEERETEIPRPLDRCRRIFIAGTGRCGTSRLADILGEHSEIYQVPMESKFIVEPGGLEDLVDCLTNRYTPLHSDQALKQFDSLMRSQLTGKADMAIKNWLLDRKIGMDIYYKLLNTFLSKLVNFEYFENVPMDLHSQGFAIHWPSENDRYRRVIARYFSDRGQLIQLVRDFVDGMFQAAARKNGKKIWCEKTPFNLLSLEFLWELFPDAAVIHIKRDPRGVVQSYMKQDWAPGDVNSVVELLSPVYSRWKEFKNRYDFSTKRYMEIKLEALSENTAEEINTILRFLGVDRGAEYSTDCFSEKKANYWTTEIAEKDRAVCENRLAEYFDLLGYSR